MPNELEGNFFYKTDLSKQGGRKLCPKTTVCTGERCEKGTAKVVWIPYSMRGYDPQEDEREPDDLPSIRYPGFTRDEAEEFVYWLRCIVRWTDVGIPENVCISEETYAPIREAIVEYPMGVLYAPKQNTVKRLRFDSGDHNDWKLYSPRGNPDFQEMERYFEGFLSSEVDSDEFRDWFFAELRKRTDESMEMKRKRKNNPRNDLSYAMRGFWLDDMKEG